MTEENDFVFVRFRMKKEEFAVFQAEADEINKKYKTKETGTSRIKALAEENATIEFKNSSPQLQRKLTALEQLELNGY